MAFSTNQYGLRAALIMAVGLLSTTPALSDMGEMGPMAAPGGGMGSMNASPPSGASMGCMECMGMMGMMDDMDNAATMAPASNLPGFPGASHLYHVGADGFFVNHHPKHIQLSVEQQTQLNQLREKALMSRAASEREIEAGEQQLFALTAADQPDASKIEAQLRTIENLRVQQRLNYIRAVGEAANVLTADQRAMLLGTKSSGAAMPGMKN